MIIIIMIIIIVSGNSKRFFGNYSETYSTV